MKRILNFLFVAFAVFTVGKYMPVNDPVIAFSIIVISAFIIGAIIIPIKYFNTGTLGVLDITIWKKYIIEKLRKKGAFIFKSRDDTRFVLGGLTVVIPQSGADPTIILNNASWPITAVRRTDTDVNYVLDSFSTTPHHIPWIELQSLSYDKIDSILGQHTNALVEAVGDKMLINWSPTTAGQEVATTGGSGAVTTPPVAGQTGTRKAFHPDDLITVMNLFNAQDVPDDGRQLLIDANMYGGFYQQLSASQANSFNQFADNKTGQLGKLHSFNVFVRSSVLLFASAATSPKAYGSSIAATDNLASLAWHEDTVCRAVGEMKPFMDTDNPLYQGDIFSMIVKFGGRKERSDNKGVVAIIQAA